MEGCKGVMSLDEYAAKRRFEKTPEPPPAVRTSNPAAKPYFCVQRHDATRLHYDFRLEIDGVLKSWAVPKGPSLDPAVKVFAAHVEDHPVEYGDFEGNIPAGNYGGGSVMLWDRGTFDLLGDVAAEAQLARGDLKFRLHGEKLKGDFAIVHMKARAKGKGNEWLLIKKRDEFAVAGWDVEALAYSVLSGRTQEEIARNLPARQTKRETAGAADRVWATSPPAKRVNRGKALPAQRAPRPGVDRAHDGDARRPRPPRRGLAVRGEVGWRACHRFPGQRRGPPAIAQRVALRAPIPRTRRDAAPHRRIAGRDRWRDRRARRQGRLAVPPHSAAHRQHRPEHHRPPGALHAGDLFRLRPALPGRLRPARRRAGEAARTPATGADSGAGDPPFRCLPRRRRGTAGGGAREWPGGHRGQARQQHV